MLNHNNNYPHDYSILQIVGAPVNVHSGCPMNVKHHYRAQYVVGAQMKFDHWWQVGLYVKGTGSVCLVQLLLGYSLLTNPFHQSLSPSPEKIRFLAKEGWLFHVAQQRPQEVLRVHGSSHASARSM